MLGFDVEVPPVGSLVFLTYADRPGVVGTVGLTLGEAGLNIGSAQVARHEQGGAALMVLTVDSEVPQDVLERLGEAIGAESVRGVTL